MNAPQNQTQPGFHMFEAQTPSHPKTSKTPSSGLARALSSPKALLAITALLILGFVAFNKYSGLSKKHDLYFDLETKDNVAEPHATKDPNIEEYTLIFYAFECDDPDCKPLYADKSVFRTRFLKGLTVSIPELDIAPTRVAGERDTWAEAIFVEDFEKVVVVLNWGSTKVNGGLKASVLIDKTKLTDKKWKTFEIAVYKNYDEDGITAKLLPPLKSKNGKSALYGWRHIGWQRAWSPKAAKSPKSPSAKKSTTKKK